MYLYHDCSWISNSWAMKLEANSILVYCKHNLSSFSEAKGENGKRIIRLDNYRRKSSVCLICCLRVGMVWSCWSLFKMQWAFVPWSMPRVKLVQYFLMEHLSTGKGLCFGSVTFYGNILLSAILLMQRGTLSMTGLGSFLSAPVLAPRQPAKVLVQLFEVGFQGPTTSGLPDSQTLIPAQHSYQPELAGDSSVLLIRGEIVSFSKSL